MKYIQHGCVSGFITDEMIEKMKNDRCGNADVVYGNNQDECTKKKLAFNEEILPKTTAFQLPGRHKFDLCLNRKLTT